MDRECFDHVGHMRDAFHVMEVECIGNANFGAMIGLKNRLYLSTQVFKEYALDQQITVRIVQLLIHGGMHLALRNVKKFYMDSPPMYKEANPLLKGWEIGATLEHYCWGRYDVQYYH